MHQSSHEAHREYIKHASFTCIAEHVKSGFDLEQKQLDITQLSKQLPVPLASNAHYR